MKTVPTLPKPSQAKIGERFHVKRDGFDAVYRRIDSRTAWAKRRSEHGESPYWFQERATVVGN